MANIYDMADTWNAAGTTFTAIKMNVTDTASAAASLLMDLQVGGVSKFSVTKGGLARANDGSVAAPSLSFISQPSSGFFLSGAAIKWASGGIDGGIFGAAYFAVPADNSFRWSSTSDSAGSTDLSLFRDAAGTLAQRNGINAQTFRVYNTFTDAANYERGKFAWNANVLEIGAERAGTGANRDVSLQASGTLFLSTVGTTRWNVSTGGHFLAQADNTYDIGAAAARPRYIYAGSAFVHPATTVASLPAAGTAGQGATAFVTDATATTARSTVAGGGANKVLVMSDGTNWLIVA